jgi:two-component system, LytTR family, response regulator
MQKKFTCMVVDDDELDRMHTILNLSKFDFIEIKGVFTNAFDALEAINKNMPQILFLDIDMEGMTGLELRAKANQVPVCVFITSYPDFALEGFELAALDFLIKPIETERFEKTVERINKYLSITEKVDLINDQTSADFFFIKVGSQQVKVGLHDVLYLEALKDFTHVVTTKNKYCVYGALGNLLKENAFKHFIRIHRSFAIKKEVIEKVGSSQVWIKDTILPIGRVYKDALSGFIN